MKTRAGPTGPARGALTGTNYEPAMGLSAACGVWLSDDFHWAGSESTGGGGGTDHATLSNLVWTSSAHTGTANRLAGFNGSGAAAYFVIGTDVMAQTSYFPFVAISAAPGGLPLWVDDGTNYVANTLVWANDAQILGELGVGDPGNEQGSIKLGGVTYTARMKVNAFGTSRAAMVLHQHSNTVEPDLVFARARGTTSSHTIVADTDILGRHIWSGWLDSTTGYARGAEIRAVADGTISTSALPTRLDFATTGAGATSPTDRWCILPNGTFRPAADNTYQLGNTSYALTEAWARQWMVLEQAAVTAPGGGWAGRSAFWGKNTTPTTPMFTDDAGTDQRLIMRTDIGTTTAAGVFEAATPAEQSSTTVLTSDDHRLLYSYPPDKCGSRTAAGNAAGSGTGFLEGITYFATPARNYIAGFGHIDSNTSSTSADRGWYLTPATNSHLTFAKLMGSRVSAKFAVPSDNLRAFVAFTEAGAPTLVPANAGNVLEVIRLGVYNNVFSWSISDGTNETTGSLTATGHTAGTVYEYEIVWTSSTSVTFNIYNADRSTLLETTTRTTGIPASGSTTTCYIGVFIRTASTTPTVYYGLGRLRIP